MQGLLIAPQPQTEYANIIALRTFVWQPKKSNGGTFIMQKNNNHSLAFDILREEKKHTRFWFVSCIVILFVSVLSHIVKGGAGNGR